jgi:hypothetical protein
MLRFRNLRKLHTFLGSQGTIQADQAIYPSLNQILAFLTKISCVPRICASVWAGVRESVPGDMIRGSVE